MHTMYTHRGDSLLVCHISGLASLYLAIKRFASRHDSADPRQTPLSLRYPHCFFLFFMELSLRQVHWRHYTVLK